jgi:hypothetical protein
VSIPVTDVGNIYVRLFLLRLETRTCILHFLKCPGLVGGGDDEGLLMIRFKKGETLPHAHGTFITASQSLCHKSPLYWTFGHSFITDIWEMEDENFYWMKIFQKQRIKGYRRGSAGRECRMWCPVICDGIRDLKQLLYVPEGWRLLVVMRYLLRVQAKKAWGWLILFVCPSGPSACMTLSYSEGISVGRSTKIYFL